MAKSKKNEIVMTQKGFFIGHLLKNGELNKDARRIDEDTIAKMFIHMFSAYCANNKTDRVLIKGEDGYKMLAIEVPTDKGDQNP